ncbi:MAG TPA: hypothetical protein VID49_08835 [Steroidobacteraceae bacterium]|jgi:hypothetical protein
MASGPHRPGPRHGSAGRAAGWYAHRRASPLVLAAMPHALYVGLSKSW